MTAQQTLRDLALMTLRTPGDAARVLLGYGIPVQALWLTLALMAVLNAGLYGASLVLNPPPADVPMMITLPSPLAYLLLLVVGLFGLVGAIFRVGLVIGGSGSLRDVLILITWMQILRFAAQLVMLVTAVILPALSALMSLAVFGFGLWIALHFIKEAHRLPSLSSAAGVMIISGLVTLIAVAVVMAVVAPPMIGEVNV